MCDTFTVSGNTHTPVAFDPVDPKRVYAAASDEAERGLRVSINGGESWVPLDEKHPWSDGSDLFALAVNRFDAKTLYTATETVLYRSVDRGESFAAVEGVDGETKGIHFASNAPGAWQTFVATDRGVFRSRDGARFESCSAFPAHVRSFAGAASSGAKGERVLWAAVAGREEGGLFRSRDDGDSWQRLGESAGLKRDLYLNVACSPTDPKVAYVTNSGNGYEPPDHFTVFRTRDGGEAWEACYYGDPRWKEKNIELGWVRTKVCRPFGCSTFPLATSPKVSVEYERVGERSSRRQREPIGVTYMRLFRIPWARAWRWYRDKST
jgi:hypothetical protein